MLRPFGHTLVRDRAQRLLHADVGVAASLLGPCPFAHMEPPGREPRPALA